MFKVVRWNDENVFTHDSLRKRDNVIGFDNDHVHM
jgi:hypothetical protein